MGHAARKSCLSCVNRETRALCSIVVCKVNHSANCIRKPLTALCNPRVRALNNSNCSAVLYNRLKLYPSLLSILACLNVISITNALAALCSLIYLCNGIILENELIEHIPHIGAHEWRNRSNLLIPLPVLAERIWC